MTELVWRRRLEIQHLWTSFAASTRIGEATTAAGPQLRLSTGLRPVSTLVTCLIILSPSHGRPAGSSTLPRCLAITGLSARGTQVLIKVAANLHFGYPLSAFQHTRFLADSNARVTCFLSRDFLSWLTCAGRLHSRAGAPPRVPASTTMGLALTSSWPGGLPSPRQAGAAGSRTVYAHLQGWSASSVTYACRSAWSALLLDESMHCPAAAVAVC